MNDSSADAAAFWEARYSDADRVWSGRVNAALAAVASGWGPGRALDLGCGEGGDVLWLAEHGWSATGIDLSPTAVERGQSEAHARGLDATFIAADLADWAADPSSVDAAPEPFDLVTASFLQSPIELPRQKVLRAAAGRVAQGGRLVLISHAAPPRWASPHPGERRGGGNDGHGGGHERGHEHGPSHFHAPEEELVMLGLDGASWQIEVAEIRERAAEGPGGEPGTHFDTVVVATRR